MSQKGFFHNSLRCTGCKACIMACNDLNDLSSGMRFRKVLEYGNGLWSQNDDGTFAHEVFAYYLSFACNHCSQPVCVQVCPTGAMHKEEDGVVSVLVEFCIGCGYCQLSCPYKAPKVDRELGHSVKCNACKDFVRDDREPACVSACPLRALAYGSIEELRGLGELANVVPLPPVEDTLPNLVIKPHAEARPSKSADGIVLNDYEL